MARGQGIKKLSDLFEKYRLHLKAPEASVVNVVKEVIADVLDIKLDNSNFSYNTHRKVLFINTKSAIKSEIMLNKEEILNHLKGRLGTSSPLDII